jgi:hypothetical protein
MSVISTLFPASVSLDDPDFAFTGGTVVTAMNSDDGDTSYLEGLNTGPERHALDDLPNTANGGKVNQVDWIYKWRNTDGSTQGKSGVYYNGVTDFDANKAGTGYTDTTFNRPNPPGGGVWTWDIVNATEGVYDWIAASTGGFRVTLARLVVDWDPFAGGFAFLVGSLIGPFLGAAIGLHEIPALARFLFEQTGRRHRITPDSFRRAFEELSLPRRRYVVGAR